ncbi:MAG TPA: VWA domain-containing protein [Alphaproteobacteria bacterium]|nr:VWA domain-containing protein [Alphaproteobacteria bacterium]
MEFADPTMLAVAQLDVSTPAPDDTEDAIDIIAVIDVSMSMAAEDYGMQSRLERGKEALLRLFPRLQPGSRVGLVTFAGTSFRQADLTEDFAALKFILQHWVKADSIPVGGSAIAAALETAIAAFEQNDRRKWLLLLSDGADWEDHQLMTVALHAQRQHIAVVSAGLGNLAPARIPQYDRHGVFQGYMAHDGQVLTTVLNERTLHYLARETDGQYLRIQSGAELAKFFSAPETATVASLHLGRAFQSFLFLALLSLAAMILCERGRPAIFRHSTRRPPLPTRNLRQRWLVGEAARHRQQ